MFVGPLKFCSIYSKQSLLHFYTLPLFLPQVMSYVAHSSNVKKKNYAWWHLIFFIVILIMIYKNLLHNPIQHLPTRISDVNIQIQNIKKFNHIFGTSLNIFTPVLVRLCCTACISLLMFVLLHTLSFNILLSSLALVVLFFFLNGTICK